jgi:hypothetical protein
MAAENRGTDVSSLIGEARRAAEDIHHRWRLEEARDAADTLAHIQTVARKAGVADEELSSQITDGFSVITRKVIAGQQPKPRRRRRRRRRQPWRRRALPTPEPPLELPPGSDDG